MSGASPKRAARVSGVPAFKAPLDAGLKNTLYPERYGAWAGDPIGTAPDYQMCCKRVYPNERWGRPHQCSRPRGFGPDQAYCKQHDPESVKARKAALEAKWREESERDRRARWNLARNAPLFLQALRDIAAGQNDPRTLAIGVIAAFEKGGK